jgi:hypothetical protein
VGVDGRADVLTQSMMAIELYTLRRALTGLTQDELDWEPHPGAWGIRRRAECQTPNPYGAPDGEWVADCDASIVEAAFHGRAIEPMATIGWLLNHIGAAPGLMAELEIVGGPSVATPEGYQRMWFSDVVPTVDEAARRLQEGWAALDRALRTTATEDTLARTYDGHPWKQGSLAVAALLNEVSHHGTQICTLRDLYAHRH